MYALCVHPYVNDYYSFHLAMYFRIPIYNISIYNFITLMLCRDTALEFTVKDVIYTRINLHTHWHFVCVDSIKLKFVVVHTKSQCLVLLICSINDRHF